MSRRRLKVSFIVTEVAGVAFYRVAQPARYLEKNGFDVRVLGYTKDAYIRPKWENLEGIGYGGIVQADIFKACQWADVVVWMALHTPDSFRLFSELRKKFSNKPFVMELDDTVFSIPAHNIASTVYYPGSPLTGISYSQIKLSDALIVSTPGLKDQLSIYHRNIHVVENAIDLSLWRCSPPQVRQRVNIGWVGGATHTKDLETIKDVIFEVLGRNKNVVFKCVHGCPEFFKHKPDCSWLDSNDPRYDKSRVCPRCGGIDRLEWTHDFKPVEKYPKWVSSQKFDIGIAPLEDNNFNRAKSNLRWLEYSAMGIPTVASNVGHFKEVLKHGENGFLAETKDEWIQAIESLIKGPQLRASVGKAARTEVKEKWSPKTLGRAYAVTLRRIRDAVPNKVGPGDSDSNVDRRSERTEVHSSASPS